VSFRTRAAGEESAPRAHTKRYFVYIMSNKARRMHALASAITPEKEIKEE